MTYTVTHTTKKRHPIYFDTETTLRNVGDKAVGDLAASPFHPDNSIVWLGMRSNGVTTIHPRKDEFSTLDSSFKGECNVWDCPDTVPVLVAQNIAFDMHHLRNLLGPYAYKMLSRYEIWDVMLAEYLLSGQQLKWASLDDLSTIYGGVLKDSRIKEYWEAGVCTTKIPDEEIIPYLTNDVENLEIIYEGQLKAAEKLGMLPLIRSQMKARAMTIIMESHGMYFCMETAVKRQKELEKETTNTYNALVDLMETATKGNVPREALNPSSTSQVEAMLYGSKGFSWTEEEPLLDSNGEVVRFKTGNRKGEIKYKKVAKHYTPSGTYDPAFPANKVALTAGGAWSTDTETLQGLANKYYEPEDSFVRLLLKYREECKMLGTYFEGYSKLAWPHDNIIHGQLNHCQTNTGRLSSSKPNLQNISNKEMEVD